MKNKRVSQVHSASSMLGQRKGFLLAEETLKIIIAVISIGFLVYFLAALYFANRDAEKLEQAGASLEFLISEVNLQREEVVLYNPEGWVLTSWPHGVRKGFDNVPEVLDNDK